MARITLGPLVERIQGRFGGALFRRYRGTDTLSRYRQPKDPRTQPQIDSRRYFRQANILYSNIVDQSESGTIGVLAGENAFLVSWVNWARTQVSASPRNGFVGQYLRESPLSTVNQHIQSLFWPTVSLPIPSALVLSLSTFNLTMSLTTTTPAGYTAVADCFWVFDLRAAGSTDNPADLSPDAQKLVVAAPDLSVSVPLQTGIPLYIALGQRAYTSDSGDGELADVVWGRGVSAVLLGPTAPSFATRRKRNG